MKEKVHTRPAIHVALMALMVSAAAGAIEPMMTEWGGARNGCECLARLSAPADGT